MKGRRIPFVAKEGIPLLFLALVATVACWQLIGYEYAIVPGVILAWLLLVFRDPRRIIPAVPLGVVSPVDGTVVEVSLTANGALSGDAHRIFIRVKSLGAYSARCPVEGKIMDFRGTLVDGAEVGACSGLWVRTDEGDDVVLQFYGHRFGLAPLAFPGYGDRIGQGQRCAYLRMTRIAEVQLPINSRLLVKEGQKVFAGVDVLAKLPHP